MISDPKCLHFTQKCFQINWPLDTKCLHFTQTCFQINWFQIQSAYISLKSAQICFIKTQFMSSCPLIKPQAIFSTSCFSVQGQVLDPYVFAQYWSVLKQLLRQLLPLVLLSFSNCFPFFNNFARMTAVDPNESIWMLKMVQCYERVVQELAVVINRHLVSLSCTTVLSVMLLFTEFCSKVVMCFFTILISNNTIFSVDTC